MELPRHFFVVALLVFLFGGDIIRSLTGAGGVLKGMVRFATIQAGPRWVTSFESVPCPPPGPN